MARFFGRVGPPIESLGHLLAFGFDVPLHIYEKVVDLKGESYSRNRAPPPPRSSFLESDWSRISPPRRDPEAVFTAFISIDHELPHHHHVWVVRCRHMRCMGIGWDWSCNDTRCSRFEGFILSILLYCVDALMLCLMLATRARVAWFQYWTYFAPSYNWVWYLSAKCITCYYVEPANPKCDI